MKNIFTLLAIAMLAFGGITQAQNLPTEAFDLAKTAPEITKKIGEIVGGFTAAEKNKVGAAVKAFLGDYNNLIPLMKSNPAEFTKKLTEIKTKFNSALKLGLAANKLKKFTGGAGNAADALMKLL